MLRRPSFINRPWITGKLYDDLSRNTVLHCDARVLDLNTFKVLAIDWNEGGRKQVARDAYVIEPDGLTPLWDTAWRFAVSVPILWTRDTPWLGPVHARVIAEATKALSTGPWSRVSLLAHYVRCTEYDTELKRNVYTERLPKSV